MAIFELVIDLPFLNEVQIIERENELDIFYRYDYVRELVRYSPQVGVTRLQLAAAI